jgi:hypothetical protein
MAMHGFMSRLSLLLVQYDLRNCTHQAELQATLLLSRSLTLQIAADAG